VDGKVANMRRFLIIGLLAVLSLAACQRSPQGGGTVTLVVDGTQQVIVLNQQTSVSDVLRSAGIELETTDRVNPPPFSPVEDGLIITVVRVREETAVVEETVPFRRLTQPSDGLPQGETRLLQAGENGVAEVTYRITYEDGIEVSRNEIRRIEITPPQDEIVLVGSEVELSTVTVEGALFYISGGNAWVAQQNSANRRPLTADGGLSQTRVFEPSDDGDRLLFTRSTNIGGVQPEESEEEGTPSPSLAEGAPPEEVAPLEEGAFSEEPFNRLWVILDVNASQTTVLPLNLENILYAEWVPGTERTIAYSTAEPRPSFPGWQANNDLWIGQITDDGRVVNRRELLGSSSGGVYGWFGSRFAFSPDGSSVAWAQPDAVGVLRGIPRGEDDPEPTTVPSSENIEDIDLPDSYARDTLAAFAPFNPFDFVWLPSIAWSADGSTIIATTHGLPLGAEADEDSPVFNLTAFVVRNQYNADIIPRSGMWAEPRYSPMLGPNGEELEQKLAYLQAIEPLDSAVSRYQLVVIDRDGSNPRVVFPGEGQPGLRSQAFSWSPDGEQISLTYQGDLYIVDVTTGIGQRLTSDGQSASPRWTR